MSDIIVRPTATAEEHDLLFWLAEQEFHFTPSREDAMKWQQYFEGMEEFLPEQRRAAFRDETFVGSYLIYERKIHIGSAEIVTGCIGAVVTHPDYRKQGIAKTFLTDAIDFARSRGHGLLLLEGIPHFYDQFGFVDVFDVSEVAIALDAIRTTPPPTYGIRLATAADGPVLLDLYQRHFSSYTGSFSRTIRQQQHRINRRLNDTPSNPPILVTDASGTVTAAMLVANAEHPQQAFDIMADDWESIRTLLHYSANLLATDDGTEIHWRIPLDSAVSTILSDHLQLPGYIQGTDPQVLYAVRSQTYHFANAAWMARLVNFPVVAQAMTAVWQQRWQGALAHWHGSLALQVEHEQIVLTIDGYSITVSDAPSSDTLWVTFTAASFIQLLFGYRTIAWAAQQSGNSVPENAVVPLHILFPSGNTWIPASDAF